VVLCPPFGHNDPRTKVCIARTVGVEGEVTGADRPEQTRQTTRCVARRSAGLRLAQRLLDNLLEMKTTLVLAFALLAAVPAFAGGPKIYDETGTMVGVKDGFVTIREPSEEIWEYVLDKDVKLKGELKAGSKVTVSHKLIAISIEAQDGDKTRAGDKAKPRATEAQIGTVVGVKDDVVTLRESSGKWEYGLAKDTQVKVELKAGAKVKIVYRVVAVSLSPWKPPANPFPEHGPRVDWRSEPWFSVPRYDHEKEYGPGALVVETPSSEPLVRYYRCKTTCKNATPSDTNYWAPAGWD